MEIEGLPSRTPDDRTGAAGLDSADVEPPSQRDVIAIPKVGGLHHRYTRAA
jgi:hypothetical protein